MKVSKKIINSIVAMLILVSMALGMLPSIGITEAYASEGFSVYGTVFNSTGNPLEDAKVVIAKNDIEVASTRTLEDGTYRLENISSGKCDIYIEGSAFLRSSSATSLKAETKRTITVETEDLETSIKIDRLTNCNKVSGIVTDTNTGNPVSNASINMGNNFNRWTASTDENGRYEVYGAPSGEIYASKSSSYDFSVYQSFVDGLNIYTIISANQMLDFSESTLISMDFELDIPTEQKIFGKVTNMGKPLTDVNINLLYKDHNNRDAILGTLLVSETGEFEFNGLYGGEYDVVVANGNKLYSTRYASKHIVLNGTDEEINYNLCKISGTVKDSSGNNVDSYSINIKNVNTDTNIGSTHGNGTSYEYKYVVPGTYEIEAVWHVNNAGTAAGQEDKILVKRVVQVTGDTIVDLKQGETYEEPVISMHKVTGTVTNSITNNKLPNAKITITSAVGAEVGTTTTDSSGRYELGNLPDGTYTVTVVYKGITKTATVTIAGSDQEVNVALEIPLVNEVTIVLDTDRIVNFTVDGAGDDHKITGTVTDSKTKDPLPGAKVEIKDKDGNKVGEVKTGPDGSYEIPNLPDGEYTITVTYPDPTNPNKDITKDIPVTIDGEDKQVDIELDIPRPSSNKYKITGTAKEGTTPLGNVFIQLLDSTGRVIKSTYSSSTGYYEFTELTPGTYEVKGYYTKVTGGAAGTGPNAGGSVQQLEVSKRVTIVDKNMVVDLQFGKNTPTTPEDKPTKPEDKPTKPEDKPTKPEDKPTKPEDKPTKPEDKPTKPEDKPTKPEDKPEDKPQQPEDKPTTPEDKPQQPEEKPTSPEDKPQQPEDKPEDKPKQPESNIDDNPVPGGNKETENPPAPDDNHKITGIVINSDTEEPLPGVPVKIKDKDGNEVGPIDTEDDGTFTIPDLPDGEYTITVTYPDPTNPIHSIIEEVTVIIDHSDEEVVIRLDIPKTTPEENYSIIGEVIDQNDNPLPGVTVEVYDETGKKIDTVKTDKDGNFILKNLPDGTYTLVASYPDPTNPDGTPIMETVKVTISGKDEKITIRMNIPDIRTGATGTFNDGIKRIAMIAAISLAMLVGLGLLWLLLLAWYRRVKVFNDINTDQYRDEDWKLVYKNYVRKEDQEEKIYYINIPKEVFDKKVTDSFKVVLKKLFVKRHNGDMFIVRIIDKDNDNAIIKSYSFEIDKEENEIPFIY